MPVIKKKKASAKKKSPKTKARALTKTKSKKPKNTVGYYECLNACCQQGIKPKNISQVSHECKTNALAVNKRMSAQKVKAVKKIKAGYEQLGQGLDEFIKSK